MAKGRGADHFWISKYIYERCTWEQEDRLDIPAVPAATPDIPILFDEISRLLKAFIHANHQHEKQIIELKYLIRKPKQSWWKRTLGIKDV
jgi:hypothetical protein